MTCVFCCSVTVQVEAFPLHPPPDQPVKTEFDPGVSVSTICVPGLKGALHVGPQLMPEGLLITVPCPVPFSAKLNDGNTLKVAVADVLSDKVIAQAPSPLHAPPHPVNTELPVGDAVSATFVPT